MKVKILTNINNSIFALLIIVFIYSMGVYLEFIPQDFWIFNMQFFGQYYTRVSSYIVIAFLLFVLRINLSDKLYAEYSILAIFTLFIQDIFGNIFGWYTVGNSYSIPNYDNFAHVLGSMLVGFALYFIFIDKFKAPENLIILAATMTSYTISTLFGVSEYVSDLYAKTAMVGGLEDAITDNIYDFIGVMLAMFIIAFYRIYILKREL